ncbi:expressed unknown protein [Seminavis robusta]|uniref:Uncharacterized protein n=1 Tax=Seminavis robusta TaxID=568900 RepID=A0A9N8HX47_9STRA|nr:expressed unknown protein [Seminavis robusta]|eukprot:Sro2125_g315630.1 n/a (364) ;mRNA; f:2285-3376
MVKLHFSTVILAALVSISSAAAWAPLSQPARDLSVFASVNERKQKRAGGFLATKRFSTVSEQDESPITPSTKQKLEVFKIPAGVKPSFKVSVPTVASVFAATVGTYFLNNHLAMGPVRASSIAGLVATMVLPENLAIAAFAGSFAGMAKGAVIPGLAGSAVLGLVCSAVLTTFDNKKWLVGVGGRLGFIAQCACTAQFLVSCLFMAPTPPAAFIGRGPLDFRALTLQLPMVAGFTVIGALFMRLWKKALADKSKRLSNSVGAVGATGLIANLALPAALAGPVFCGSFVAMAAPTKLPNVKSLILASFLAGAAQQSLAGVMLGGWGGKLGTAALMGVLAYTTLAEKVFRPKELERPEDNMMNMK